MIKLSFGQLGVNPLMAVFAGAEREILHDFFLEHARVLAEVSEWRMTNAPGLRRRPNVVIKHVVV